MMSLSAKLVANRQKRNLIQMREQLKEKNLDDAVVQEVYYPESSDLLKIVLKNMRDGLWQKETYISSSSDCESQLTKHLATVSSGEKTVLCIFPDYTPQIDDVTSDLPVLEVLANTIDEWYKVAKGQRLHFFLCSSKDLRKGVALDVYEADPVVHQTAGAVFDLYFWNT
jgi:peptidyl-tRNA hydrolase